jgi:DNA (cytosine-5)-methyltransferase 1
MPRPIAIDLFAGAGGLSLGFEQAGFDVVAAVEVDPIHCAVHHFNFPDCAVIPQSVSDLTGDEIRARAGIGRRKVHVVFGGPPCQGFSLIGQRAMDDPRNNLVRDFVRLVGELKASYFVFENVKGLTVGRHRLFLEELVETFEECGYRTRRPWQILDAADYGVPQHRERLILMGARKGLPLPAYPQPICRPADAVAWGDMQRGPTCGDALSDLPDVEQFVELMESDEVHAPGRGKSTEYTRAMRCIGKEAWHYGYPRKWDRGLLTSSMRTEHTAISRRRFHATEGGAVEPISRFFRLSAHGLSNTLRAGTDSSRGAFTSPRPIHYKYSRCITVREMARLHGYPDWFRFHTTKWHGARQVGNSVPPPLARAVAGEMIRGLGFEPEHIDNTIELGDPELLRMDMSQAASHFGIAVPIKRRDRKSGARKRKQHEIEAERSQALLFDRTIAVA